MMKSPRRTNDPTSLFILSFIAFALLILGCAGSKKYSAVSTDGDSDRSYTFNVAEKQEPQEYYETMEEPYEKSRDHYEKAEVIGYLNKAKTLTLSAKKEQLENQLSEFEEKKQQISQVSEKSLQPERQIAKQPPAAGRMIHYDGTIRQRATDPEKVLDSAIRYARSLGGDLEFRDMTSVALRVPVEKFREAFQTLLSYAEVLEKSITALDITESFKDKELRLKIAQSTIERLKTILAKTEKDEDKIRLLNEIKRLSETVEALQREKQALKAQADFSVIRMTVTPHHPKAGRYARKEIEGFNWITGLTPFNKESRYGERYLAFTVPKGMVAVKRNRRGMGSLWRASSADGTEFWSCSRKNQPCGNTDFWFASLRERLTGEFAAMDSAVAGSFKVLRLTSYDADPYIYLVGVRTHGKRLDVVEAYFPSEQQEKRYKTEILSAISGGGS